MQHVGKHRLEFYSNIEVLSKESELKIKKTYIHLSFPEILCFSQHSTGGKCKTKASPSYLTLLKIRHLKGSKKVFTPRKHLVDLGFL